MESVEDVVVAIDGPGGAGKSTVARAVAERAGLRHLDTGATYRALTLALLRRGVPVDDPAAVAAAVVDVDVAVDRAGTPRGGTMPVLLAGRPCGPELRDAAVTAAVSTVAAVPAVRERLVALQREAIGAGGVVADGRDVGTVVWPQAEVKVFLTAHPAERARRRAGAPGGESASALARRDLLDSGRAVAPTRASPDAVVIDSTGRSVADVVGQVLELVEKARAGWLP